MGFMDTIRDRLRAFLLPGEYMDDDRRTRLVNYEKLSAYWRGEQARQLKKRAGQADDNIILNYAGLVVDRGVALLLGGGVEFDLQTGEEAVEVASPEQEYIEKVWEANKQENTLHNAAQYAAVFGTGFFKLMPEATISNGEVYTRIVTLDPRWLTIQSAPEDIETVVGYESRFRVHVDGEDVDRKENIDRVVTVDENGLERVTGWTVTNYQADGNGDWFMLPPGVVQWEYDFAPILHWQNQPLAGSVYGESDLAGILPIQDRINFVAGNISKIIRYHAHPRTWGRNTGQASKASWGADEMVIYSGEGAMVQNLEMQSDLASSAAYLLSLRQTMFDISRTVDISSMSDKLGALTNFGLRVLYSDALAKLRSKQGMLGDALTELNRRILIINGMEGAMGGKVVWGDSLPTNLLEKLQAAQISLDLGLSSKETLARDMGSDWDEEKKRIEAEAKDKGETIGSMLLDFEQGSQPASASPFGVTPSPGGSF